MSTEKKNLFLKIYFLIGAVAGLIGTLIGYGGLLSNAFQRVFISDTEYVAGQMYYEIQTCEQPTYQTKPENGQQVEVKKTPEEITVCKTDAMTRIAQQRAYTLKSEMITGVVRGSLFFIIFLTHLPWLRRQYQDDDE